VIKNRRAILALLTCLNLINYIDRFLVAAVSPKIQASLSLTDGETGTVLSAFMLGYFLTSPLFGWLGDRYPRKALIAAGVAAWSIATICSGFAGTFATMVATRVAVGLGEASYATLSPTIIDDIAPAGRKDRWLAIFYVAIPVGAALGFVLGGAIEDRYGWRSAFFICGGPGIALALLTLLVDEPARAEHTHRKTGLRDYVELFRRPVYRATVLGYVAQTFALGGFTAWAATFLYRKLCLELKAADSYFGAITVVTGLLGTALGGTLADRLAKEDRARVNLRICAWSSLLAAPAALVALLRPTPTGFLIALGVCELAVFMSIAPTNSAVLSSVPAHMRAQAMAASIFSIHLFGDLVSPPIIGFASDAFGDLKDRCSGAAGLQTGMYLLPLALLLSGVAWWRGSAVRGPAEAQSPR
jgi:MFS transporter, Spinster family, sphingosine-1-phosphate transporter